MGMNGKKLLLIFGTTPAQFQSLLGAFDLLLKQHNLLGYIIIPEGINKGIIQDVLDSLNKKVSKYDVYMLPSYKSNFGLYGFEKNAIKTLLKKIKPHYIWIHAEFWEGITRQILLKYKLNTRTRVISYMAINHIDKPVSLFMMRWPYISRTRFYQLFLWSRLNGVSACATKSMECAYRIGLPGHVPASVNFLPVIISQDMDIDPIHLPWDVKKSFIVGFAGTINEQKGWKILLRAIKELPEKFKVVLIGDGEQKDELQKWIKKFKLKNRIIYLGYLSKNEILTVYRLFNVFVLPSITTVDSVEQFGMVLAEAMGSGVPVIGSDSGAIPETISEAGIIVPEGDVEALAQAILRMSSDVDLRSQCIKKGYERYKKHFTCDAYAGSIANLLGLSGDDTAQN